MFFVDPLYIIFALPALAVSLIATLLLNHWNSKYSRISNSRGVSGREAAQLISQRHNFAIDYQETDQPLGDNYHPGDNVLTLSAGVARESSIASVAIAAHELGHVQQDFSRSVLLSARSLLVPAVNIGSNLGYLLIFLGLILEFSGLAWLGLGLFSLALVFSLLTLPIELDASRRALNFISELDLLTEGEQAGAKKVLTGAALTYVAAVVAALGSFVYFFLRVRGINSRDE